MEGTIYSMHFGKEVPGVWVNALRTCKTVTVQSRRKTQSTVFFFDDERTLRNFRNNLMQQLDAILNSNDLQRKETCPHA